jgi:hypothetical protein
LAGFLATIDDVFQNDLGAMAIPISYVFHEHDVPTEEMIMKVYADSDEELMAS